MGVHTGAVETHGDGDYLGPTVNRAARIADRDTHLHIARRLVRGNLLS